MVLTKDNYNKEIQRLLDDTAIYQKLTHDPTFGLKHELICWFKKGLDGRLLVKKKADYLVTRAPRIPVFYIVPKIHKCKDNPPGRPIVKLALFIFQSG